MKINKSIYLEYLKCAKNVWLKLYRPEVFDASENKQNFSLQGQEVEQLAQQLFAGGVYISEKNKEKAVALTQKHIELKTPVLFQPTFVSENFLVRNDVLKYDEKNAVWDLYEIKAKTKIKEGKKEKIDKEIIEDVTFQFIVLKDSGLKIGKVFIIYLNKEYIRGEQLEINGLFKIEDISDKVIKQEEDTRSQMKQSQKDLLMNNEHDVACLCINNGRSNHCPTFSYSHKDVPEYSVHDIAYIGKSKEKLEQLVYKKILNINDVPDSFSLSKNQQNQVNVYKSKKPIIQYDHIKRKLDELRYPLYFLDYETFSLGVPEFNGTKPFQKIPFQFSLHVVNDPYKEPQHFEYLHEKFSDSSFDIIYKLLGYIGTNGSVLVWHKSFEESRNKELAIRYPRHSEFLTSLNSRMYDLEKIFTGNKDDVFKDQMYVHSLFRGKTSIKNVLPVLVPELSYDTLDIQKGDIATEKWLEMVCSNRGLEEKQKIAENLRKYCKLDTYAMYKIWQFLLNLKEPD